MTTNSQAQNLVRFLHTSDWQLGATRSFLSDEAQGRWTTTRFDVIRRVAYLARQEKCEFVVVAGDVFESNQVDRRTILRACEALASVRMPVYLLPGNHDPLDAGAVFNSALWETNKPDHVQVLSDPGRSVEVRSGVEVLGAPWFSKRPLSDLVSNGLEAIEPTADSIRVMVAHGAVDTLSPDPNNPALINVEHVEVAIAEGKIHYLALGDRHSVTDIGSTGRIWYSGTPEIYAFNEIDPGHALVATKLESSPAVEGEWPEGCLGAFSDGGDDLMLALARPWRSHCFSRRQVLRGTPRNRSLRSRSRRQSGHNRKRCPIALVKRPA